MRMYQVDAFTDRVFAGNPAAVLVLENWLDDDLMLAIAAENNLAETAFVKQRDDATWDLRWFTPLREVAFCGHATLATAHVLLSKDLATAPLRFQTRVGELRVTKAEKGYALDVPCLEPEYLDPPFPEIAGMVKEPIARVFRNFENVFLDLGSAQAVYDFIPDLAAIAGLEAMGLVVTGRCEPVEKADFVSRYFAPNSGIPEDPVTGSTHATLVPYWASVIGKQNLLAYQASARGGWIRCELSGPRVFLTGDAVTYLEADLFLQ